MTNSEFKSLCKEFGSTFPSWAAWFGRLEDTKKTAAAWYPAFIPISFLTAQRVIPLMRDNMPGYAPLEAYEYEEFPRVLPKYCRRWEASQREEEQRQQRPHYEGAFQHVTENDAVMSGEFKRLTTEMERILGHPLPIRSGDEWNASLLTKKALKNIGGIQIG